MNREKISSSIETQSKYFQIAYTCCLGALHIFLGINCNNGNDSVDPGSHNESSCRLTCSGGDGETNGNVNDELAGDTGSASNDVSFEAESDSTPYPKFTVTEELEHSHRYEEGYDLPNPHYEEW